MSARTKQATLLTTRSGIRPFLKWAGNKYRLVDRIQRLLPGGKRLVEPFVGSGAVFLNTHYDRYLLCDNNADLISLYQILQGEGDEFIRYCQRLFTARNNQPEVFYKKRELFNSTSDPHLKAALFVYLNRHGYNGLCRYNASGGFNVPFGRYKQPYFPAGEMQQFHLKAKKASFRHADFTSVIKKSRSGDVIYCDPPYFPLSTSANFTSYSAGGFSEAQQKDLARLAELSIARGIPVLISNHSTHFTLQVYAKASDVDQFAVRRYISCNGNKREQADELLALFA